MTLNRASQLAIIAGVVVTCLLAGAGAMESGGALAQRVTALEVEQKANQTDHDLLIRIDAGLTNVEDRLGIAHD